MPDCADWLLPALIAMSGMIGVTVSVAVPFVPLLDAVIVTVPAATPVANPVGDTVAVASLLLLHVMTFAPIGMPSESRATPVSATLCPTVTLGLAGAMVTLAGGGGTTIGADSVASAHDPASIATPMTHATRRTDFK